MFIALFCWETMRTNLMMILFWYVVFVWISELWKYSWKNLKLSSSVQAIWTHFWRYFSNLFFLWSPKVFFLCGIQGKKITQGLEEARCKKIWDSLTNFLTWSLFDLAKVNAGRLVVKKSQNLVNVVSDDIQGWNLLYYVFKLMISRVGF